MWKRWLFEVLLAFIWPELKHLFRDAVGRRLFAPAAASLAHHSHSHASSNSAFGSFSQQATTHANYEQHILSESSHNHSAERILLPAFQHHQAAPMDVAATYDNSHPSEDCWVPSSAPSWVSLVPLELGSSFLQSQHRQGEASSPQPRLQIHLSDQLGTLCTNFTFPSFPAPASVEVPCWVFVGPSCSTCCHSEHGELRWVGLLFISVALGSSQSARSLQTPY